MVPLRRLFFALIFIFNIAVAAQTDSTSPVRWQYYAASGTRAAFLMPKLPVVVESGEICRGEETLSYGSYAAGVAYVVRITSKIEPGRFCREKRNFSRRNFVDRVRELRKSLQPAAGAVAAGEESNELKLSGKNQIVRLVNNYENLQWFELSVYGADESQAEVRDFLTSLKIEKNPTGIEIGRGAVRTLGDEPVETAPVNTPPATGRSGAGGGSGPAAFPNPAPSAEKGQGEPLRIILKPAPRYTEMARNTNTEGKVVLRVTFLTSGGIGTITLVEGLPYGLTEQAIAAAAKILFLPPSRNGVRYSVVKTVEYTFSIY